MTKKKTNQLNSFIKNKLMNEFHKYQSFINHKDMENNQIISIIVYENQFWATILYETFYAEKFEKTNKKSFLPFILYPITINNIIEKTNMDGELFFNKYNSITTNYEIEENLFFFKNEIIQFEDTEEDEEVQLINIDKTFRNPIYILSNNDKKSIIQEIKKIKSIDIYDQFQTKQLKKFIENKIEEYILDTNNYLTFSFFDQEVSDFQDLNIRHLKRGIKSLPISFKANEEKINIIMNNKGNK